MINKSSDLHKLLSFPSLNGWFYEVPAKICLEIAT
jgi:hypothetical protein